MPTVSNELRAILPTWAIMVLLPLPVATFWLVGSGPDFAYVYLFLGCAVMVAERFHQPMPTGAEQQTAMILSTIWETKMTALGIAATGAVFIFTSFVWAMTGELDGSVPLFATLAVLPALGCVPYCTLKSGHPYAAVFYTALLMAGVKMAGCVVVVFVYGWGAQAAGHTMLPWRQPNLLVWLCLAGAMSCSVAFYLLGRREFLKGYPRMLPA